MALYRRSQALNIFEGVEIGTALELQGLTNAADILLASCMPTWQPAVFGLLLHASNW